VPDTTAASHLERTSLVARAAAEHAAELKTSKYSNLMSTYDFVPVAVETFGAWSECGLMFVKTLGKRMAKVSGEQQ